MKKAIKIAKLVAWSFGVIGLMVCLGFSAKESEKIKCSKIEVLIDHASGNSFVTEADIKEILYSKGDSVVGGSLASLPITTYEKLINSHPSIRSSEVYTRLNGTLSVNVEQRQPVVRIITARGESFYLDSEGFLMPLSQNYTARVPVATGQIHDDTYKLKDTSLRNPSDSLASTTTLDDIYKLVMFIRQDEFWNAQIQQLVVDEKAEVTMIPRVGNQEIALGQVNDLESRFRKLWIFYQKGLNRTGWDQYSKINLKYRDQVICTKR